jgi:hypothetical protein
MPPRNEPYSVEDNQGIKAVDYTIAMKRDYSQNYDTKATGSFQIVPAGSCIPFTDFFSGWSIERNFTVPRWNLTINGPVFLKLTLKLRNEDFAEGEFPPLNTEEDGTVKMIEQGQKQVDH